MEDPTLYWTKVAAIGQVAGAIATFAAAVVSLVIAFPSRKPRIKLTVGKRVVFCGGKIEAVLLMFDIANAGERPVHVNGIGWETGWLRWGPKFIAKQFAVQLTGMPQYGSGPPPFEIQPGAAVQTYALMENVLEHARERGKNRSREIGFLGAEC